MVKIILLLCFILALYWLIPFILSAGFSIGVLKRKETSEKIAFTFDDGPNRIFTPQLLDLLKKYNIKATFFVLGSKAEKYPELIARMHEEGHLIGMHNYVHKSNWVMGPWTIRKQLGKTAAIIENITGERPIYYRPPWGLLNLFDFFLMKKYKMIHWSVMAEDWRSKGGSEKIKTRLIRDIKNGDVVLLHDCGETFGADQDAPANTIDALKDVFKELSSQGKSCVRIDEL
ncbi:MULTISPECIES: polysaccharide deacetylase family protein [Neobacillus]|uniref:Polysaccharide deacetylase family protein n=1 Tax=Neobacillus rhizophilus TaxID=2833579 RepID=A0A942YY34_9BACI|nr:MULTISPECIES: polysaccharide deacetylase family protein [Neobacillus]MBS4214516.1 polysaccharide deacetylase family protein [Neobacillus rhizophilus]